MERNTHTFRQFRVSNSPHINVFDMWEVLRSLLENPTDSRTCTLVCMRIDWPDDKIKIKIIPQYMSQT